MKIRITGGLSIALMSRKVEGDILCISFIFSVTDGSPFVVKDRKPVRQSEANRKVVAALEESSDGGEDGSDGEPLLDKHPSRVSSARVKRQAVIKKYSVRAILKTFMYVY